MNMQKTLRKIKEELDKDQPNISYIRGMLEVMIDEETTPPMNKVQPLKDEIPPTNLKGIDLSQIKTE